MSSKSHFFKQDNSELIDGLIHHYNFEETSGLITSDNIGSIDGGIQGGVTLNQTGKVNKVFDYDGIDGTVNFNSNLDITSYPFAVKLWAYIPDIATTQYILTGSSLTSYIGVSILNLSGGTVYVRFGDGLGTSSGNRRDYRQSFSTLTNGWNHIVVNFISFGNIEIYVNALNQTVTYISGTATSADLTNALYKLSTNGQTAFYNNKIDELGFYNKVLSADIIQDIYNKENAGQSIL